MTEHPMSNGAYKRTIKEGYTFHTSELIGEEGCSVDQLGEDIAAEFTQGREDQFVFGHCPCLYTEEKARCITSDLRATIEKIRSYGITVDVQQNFAACVLTLSK